MTTTSENELEVAQAVCHAEHQPAARYLEAVDRIVAICLQSPELVGGEALSALGAQLRRVGLDESVRNHTLVALSTLAYNVPALVSGTLEIVQDFLRDPPAGIDGTKLASSLFLSLVKIGRTSSIGAVAGVLQSPSVSGPLRSSLLASLPQVAEWDHTDVGEEQLRQLLESPGLSAERRAVGQTLERLCLRHPEGVTPQMLELLDASKLVRGLHYLLSWLGGRKSLPEETRRELGEGSEFSEEVRSAVRKRLGDGNSHVLIIHNIDDSRSSEVVRVTTLGDGLLALNRWLDITLVTRRPYLYDHPRVKAISVKNAGAVYDCLNSRFQAVIDFYDLEAEDRNYRPELEPAVQEYISSHRPPVIICAGKGTDQFTFSRVVVDGLDYVEDLGLDVQRVPNVYDPSYRLAAEFGLPLRMGEEQSDDKSILVASPSDEARAEWTRLSERCGAGDRPIALVNPFGESDPLSGFTLDRAPSLAAELEALVEEGYSLVVLPNGLPWGRGTEAVDAVRSEFRPFITMAPDLVSTGADSEVREKTPLGRADRVTRWFKYFSSYADLVVTVEGWLMHLTYEIGKPYRLLMMPYSGQMEWHPYGASRRQHIVGGMSPATSPGGGSELLRESDAPPLPRYPRKELLLNLLQGLGQMDPSFASDPLLLASRSADRHVRAAAIAALAGFEGEEIGKVVLGALRDRSWEVRTAAAEGLLRSRRDLRWELDEGYEPALRCHVFIGTRRWSEVLATGKAGVVPLILAMADEDPVMRREAKHWFKKMTGTKKDKPSRRRT